MHILSGAAELPDHLRPESIDLLATAFFDGTGGYAVLDSQPETASSAAVVVGDFVYPTGIPDLGLVRELAEHHDEELHVMPAGDKWWSLLERDPGARTSRYARYAFDTERFDWEFFARAGDEAEALAREAGVSVQRMSGEHIRKHGNEDWFDDLICQFPDADAFLARGIGFVVIENGEVVSGASSYAVYTRGIEVEVGTRKDRRGRGYATLASRALLAWGRETHTFVAWDAANLTSKRLAERLGYRDARAYECLLYRASGQYHENEPITGRNPD
ncbi:MAG: GNAT family N-acetyltransferase [Spirochaetaceae bacterium]|nr:MAG: GNAT family N-acetyltransferase [Spirochaetaceae bacterium]